MSIQICSLYKKLKKLWKKEKKKRNMRWTLFWGSCLPFKTLVDAPLRLSENSKIDPAQCRGKPVCAREEKACWVPSGHWVMWKVRGVLGEEARRWRQEVGRRHGVNMHGTQEEGHAGEGCRARPAGWHGVGAGHCASACCRELARVCACCCAVARTCTSLGSLYD